MTQKTREERRRELSTLSRHQLVLIHRAGAGCLMPYKELKRWPHEDLEAAILEAEYGPLTTATTTPEETMTAAPITLPTWEEMSDYDRGQALIHLAKCYSEGAPYAREHYPIRYRDHVALAALPPINQHEHALNLFADGIETALDLLGEAETDRLCQVVFSAEQAERKAARDPIAEQFAQEERETAEAAAPYLFRDESGR